jgi:hypothetical protein
MALVAGSLLAADTAPKDAIKDAIKKLADAGSYSWKATVDTGGGGGGGPFRPGPTEGKVGKDGFACVSITRGENTTEAVIKGDKRVVKTQEGWQTPDELAAAGGGGGGGRGRGGAIRALRVPTVEAEDLLGKVKELKVGEGVCSGDLTEEGAKSLLSFGGRGGGGQTQATGAKASVKFWVKEGVLSKYEYNVQGTVSFGGQDRDINRTTTVEIKDVGTTTVTVPEDAKKKLSS